MKKKEIPSENYRDYFEIVPKGHHNCQLSILNCQFTKVRNSCENRVRFGAPFSMGGKF